ncbi:putative bifunctional diguanylate cyclase/phosphodiesterase [Noviherbaspirillum galbum]|uniref:EAL domain-containing protein n=1 Tax=Noviherbaspirillum galbum TaxID=2709383 RepID=A0A6B3STB2_9BURK|nr:EAL domain-containing protein [Noviherbaspirillum galbum]NEX64007.1 EAL domain-containing protein [Noviherbaspirillum galbum]
MAGNAIRKTAQVDDGDAYRRVFYRSPDYISISRLKDGLYIDVNASYERFVGMTRERIIGRTATELGVWPEPEERQRLVDAVRRLRQVNDFAARLRSRDGELRNVEISATITDIDGEEVLIALIRDVTERMHDTVELQQYREHLEVLVSLRTSALREANGELLKSNYRLEQAHQRLQETEKRIRYMALHDSLTGLPNRVLLHDRVNHAIMHADRERHAIALLFIDLDNFKHVNDSLGHLAGDELLCEFASRIRRCIRKSDTLARLGGDEFVICLPKLRSTTQVGQLAQKILDTLEEPFIVRGQSLHAGASMGIGMYPGDGETVDALMQAADTAMYHAKAKGKGNYQFFTASLNTAVQQRLAIESQLRNALPHGELLLHYQPQVDLRSGRIMSAEALLRWLQPARGMIQPLDFIPVAEESGLILKIGEWVLREACRQLRVWRDDGHAGMSIAVNLSARQAMQPGFSDVVAAILEEHGLPPEALDLEITESVLMEPSEENIATLRCLSAMGVRLSVDDFGTGYSSLSYLKRFPISALKIDRSFVAGIATDASDMAITDTIIAMARHLHLQVIAEGVETAEQVEFLSTHACALAQGYFFGRPMDADCLTALLRQQEQEAAGRTAGQPRPRVRARAPRQPAGHAIEPV